MCTIDRLRKEFLLRGYDFDYVEISQHRNLLYNSHHYCFSSDPEKIYSFDTDIGTFFSVSFDVLKSVKNIVLPGVEKLYAVGVEIKDISAFETISLPNLKYLYLYNNQIKDIYPLIHLDNLEKLDLFNNKIEDITPLFSLKNLKVLDLRANEGIPQEQLDKLKEYLGLTFDGITFVK